MESLRFGFEAAFGQVAIPGKACPWSRRCGGVEFGRAAVGEPGDPRPVGAFPATEPAVHAPHAEPAIPETNPQELAVPA
jgi:hypothetical protein